VCPSLIAPHKNTFVHRQGYGRWPNNRVDRSADVRHPDRTRSGSFPPCPPRRSHVAWHLGRGGGRGGRWAARKRELGGERDGCEFGRLGDECDRLDPFRRSGESWHTYGHEQRPRCDLAEAVEPGEESDTLIVWT